MSSTDHRGETPNPRGLMRLTRLGRAVTLGVDGRVRSPDDPLSGLVGGTAEETAEAASLVDAARMRADELIRAAARQSATIEDHARSQGYMQGLMEGRAAGRAELAQALDLVQRVAREAKATHDDLLRQSEPELVEMVIAAFRAVIGARIEADPDLVSETVRRAVERAGSQNIVRVRVHPDAVERVTTSLHTDLRAAPPFEVAADGAIGIGGCVVDTAVGLVDARLDVQMDEIAQLLREALPERIDDIEAPRAA